MDNKFDVSRRGLFHIIGAGAAASIAEAQEAHHEHTTPKPVEGANTPLRGAFNDHQRKTAGVLADWIIPKDDRSGSATDAGVPAFLEDWIMFRTEEDGNDRLKAEILGGLTWLDRESRSLFSADFVDASRDQQEQIIKRIAWPAKAAKEDMQWAAFFNTFRDLTVSGFFSSKMGVADLPYLGNTVVTHWVGCDPKVWAVIEDRLKNGYHGLIPPRPSQNES